MLGNARLTPPRAVIIGPPIQESSSSSGLVASYAGAAPGESPSRNTEVSHVATMRSDRQDCSGRTPGEPFEHQDEAAFPTQPTQHHPDLGCARPLDQAARVGKRPQDG